MELLELMRTRRSIRKYTDAPVSEENITKILQAGMLSATGKGIRPWEFIVVIDKDVLQKMADCRAGSVKMLKEAPCAIVVLGNEDASDVWTEDCSAVMSNMHLMAESLGLGSCWIQGRLRKADGGESTEEFCRRLFGVPEGLALEAVLSVGITEKHPNPHLLQEAERGKVHYGTF